MILLFIGMVMEPFGHQNRRCCIRWRGAGIMVVKPAVGLFLGHIDEAARLLTALVFLNRPCQLQVSVLAAL
ncbi:MAG: hypothetical protein U5N10_04645 [Gemmobacter sp.]|nr:hypothetical protein [Gemmobacter sp.]